MKDIHLSIKEWFAERNLNKADPTKQMLKFIEEVGELASAMVRSDKSRIVDAIGDIQVVLIGLSMQLDLDSVKCLEAAYEEIKYRKGRMVDGVFVKEEDLR